MTSPAHTDEYLPAVRPAEDIVRAVSAETMAEALDEYRKIQAALDRAMPDAIQEIQGKNFRKKSYWRAVALAFNLDLELHGERRIELEDDWGYEVTYCATARNGRKAFGDGACTESEKRGSQGTIHNVRSHAHTRAINRAISNLVGFGEVSAEEVEGQPARRPRKAAAPQTGAISEKQRGLLWGRALKRAEALGAADPRKAAEFMLRELLASIGVQHTNELPANQLDDVLSMIADYETG